MKERILIYMSILGGVAVIFIALPIINVFASVGIDGIIEAMKDKNAINAIIVSFEAAFFATLLSLIFGVPLAYILARKDFPGKSLIESIIDLPVIIPHTVAGIALLMIFGSNGLIGAPLEEFGVKIVDSMLGITIAMMFVSMPFLINYAREGFEAVDPRLEYIAMSLGATKTKAIFSITLPLSIRSIFVGSLMTWARAISEFGAVVVIAYFPLTAPSYIYSQYLQYGLKKSAPIAAFLLFICIVIFISLRIASTRWKRYDKD
ncbi:MAG: molybdenum ABC transporter permease [Thermoplasmata archaeon]|nr:MAG: molybdenum ABC transporter permease [Thermoplasmata archaeon]HDN95683.1 ABC transporter permease subunit [Thermoplasmatales archaeon]